MLPEKAELRLTFPHLGDYRGIFREVIELTGCAVIEPPPITRRTLELGTRHSPESVCVPFKYNLGNYLEAIEFGANAVFATAGGCRLEYYAEVHKQILKDLGHDIRFFRLNPQNTYREFRELNPKLSKWRFWSGFSLVIGKLKLMDELGDMLRKRKGFEVTAGSFDSFWQDFLAGLAQLKTKRQLARFARKSRRELLALPVSKPLRPLRVGVIGELYLVMEYAANFQLEDKLMRMGIELHRWVSATSILHHGLTGARTTRSLLRSAGPYARYHVGAHGTESIARVNQMIGQRFDGAIHIKPFGCMPEINAMPALHKMCKEHKFPLVTLSFDSHTAETGVQTRLEAFYDMIACKRQGGMLCMSAT